MKVSLSWLKELLAPSPRTAALDGATVAEALTRVGLEVESIEERGRELEGVIIAEVLGIRPHPSADKLRLVRVRAGAREDEVVCGAPNVPPPGNRVVWAPPGARLPGGRRLEAKEVRGVMSPGMLCSEPELGLGEKGDGILILSPREASGADFASTVGALDDVLEVNVTPNRGDALSHLGMARELAAALDLPLQLPSSTSVKREASGPARDVIITPGAGCPRYQARFVTGLAVAPSPITVRLRLAACGVRPISNLVDVTNYILLELGHPLHAFDLDRVEGPITVRRAKPAEVMTTLDGTERKLEPGDIVIADERGAVALAGVMGGSRTEVTSGTKNVLLEAATFDPISVRRTSRRLGLISEASYRYERGVDPAGIPLAAARAAELLAQLGGGAVLEAAIDRYPEPPTPRRVRLPLARLSRVSGLSIDAATAARELAKVVDDVAIEGDAGQPVIAVTVPSRRPDLALPEDLVEEVLRLSGRYEAPAQIERVLANAQSRTSPELPSDRLRDVLAAAGLAEIVTWGFVPRTSLAAIAGGEASLADGVLVKNPISADYEAMRTSLLPGLLDAAARNVARGLEDVALFEVGPIVQKQGGQAEDGPAQRERAAFLLVGRQGGWLRPGEPLDFYDLKRVVESALSAFGVRASWAAVKDVPFLHPGVAAAITGPGGALGCAGELHPAVTRRLGLERRAFYAELDVDALAAARGPTLGSSPPRFPAVTRDLSFWIDVAVPASAQKVAFQASDEPLLRDLAVLEDFRDPKYVAPGKKGMLWTMTYRSDERTLTDAEVDAAHARVVAALRDRLAIDVR